MFDKLVDVFVNFFEWFVPFVVILEYERGVVLRFGRFQREIGPGFHWVWPFKIDHVMHENVVTRTNNLTTIVLTTADGRSVQIGVILRWRIKDVRKLLLDVEDADHAIRDISYGEIGRAVRRTAYDDINTDGWVNELYKAIRGRGHRFGIDVEEVQVSDYSPVRALRLITDLPQLPKADKLH